jgi:RNA polymerase-binding transcription factor DksA
VRGDFCLTLGLSGEGLAMFERHADPIDEAAALAASLADGAIAAARRANAPETHPDFDGESCIDCGDTIPEARLAMQKVRCVHCQSVLERRQKQVARPGWTQNSTWDNPEA